MRLPTGAAAAALAVILAVPAAAQDPCTEYVRAPAVGGWSSYQMLKKDKPEGAMKYAIVGRAERDGGEMHWVEMTMSDKKGKEQMTMKMLVPGWPYDASGIEELIMQPAGGKPQKIGGPMLGMMKSQAARGGATDALRECQAMVHVGNETVTVPGGTFETSRYRHASNGSEVWATAEVPFGFVKVSDGKEMTLVLTGHGTDARSVVTE